MTGRHFGIEIETAGITQERAAKVLRLVGLQVAIEGYNHTTRNHWKIVSDASVQGGFEFFGPVIVKGRLKTTGTGGHFNGGVIAANIDLDQNDILGNAVISYSSCALIKTLNATAAGAPLRERSWVNLF